MPVIAGIWPAIALAVNLVAALAALSAAVWIGGRRMRFGPAGSSILAGLLLCAVWGLVAASSGGASLPARICESLMDMAWLLAIYRLFASDGRHASVAPIRPVVIVLLLIVTITLGLELAAVKTSSLAAEPGIGLLGNIELIFRLLVAVGGLLLVHNLFLGASPNARRALRWPATAFAVMWAFSLNYYTIAYLAAGWPTELTAVRGLSVAALAALLAIGAMQGREALRLRPSRAVTFQTVSLMVIGGYFLGMLAIAQWLTYAGGDFAQLIQFGFLIAASVLALFILPSRRLRGWLRVTLAKHLFQHRYDYRAEWLRFTRTIGNAGDKSQPLEQRVVQAVADIAESPAGLLLAPDDNGDLVLAACWQWPEVETPAVAMPASSAAFFEAQGFIVDLDDWRGGRDNRGEGAFIPEWLRNDARAWALVPLVHYDRLTGIVVLARPLQSRKFDWEDFDLLRVVGQQLASYLSEHAGQQALAEASRFENFNRRIAFVMHDIKNLASQLSLLARNAELYADKPAFRDDMLLTLRNSADKLNILLARLSRYGGASVNRLNPVAAADVMRSVAARFVGQPQVVLADVRDCSVTANRESLEQVLVHLVQNAIDASPAGAPVFLALASEGLAARFEVVDAGCGMSPEFVRTKLFKPFVSSKPGGFGIGAFEARELVRAMRGRLEVESREGLGSRFIIRLPLATTSSIFQSFAENGQIDGQKVA